MVDLRSGREAGDDVECTRGGNCDDGKRLRRLFRKWLRLRLVRSRRSVDVRDANANVDEGRLARKGAEKTDVVRDDELAGQRLARLFGGVDNRNSSLWMVTVDYERMTATWERLCCEDDREQLTNQLQKWSSAVWNNNLYIYFCQRTEGNCESIIYYKNLGNAAEWRTKESRGSGIGTFCKSDQTVFGRFAYTTDDIGNLVMADFNRVEYNMAGERKFPANSKALLGAQSNGMFCLRPDLMVKYSEWRSG